MPHRLVVVDDQASWIEVLGAAIDLDSRFELAGTACDGVDAIAAVLDDCPDAIVCDVQMPRLTGLQALPQLRANCPTTKIVIYSADPAAADEAHRLGADAVIDKATDPFEVLELLAQMLEAPQK